MYAKDLEKEKMEKNGGEWKKDKGKKYWEENE